MVKVETVLTPRVLLDRMYERLVTAYQKAGAAQSGSIQADEELVAAIDAIGEIYAKLDKSALKKLQEDMSRNNESFEELEKLHDLLDEIVDGKKVTLHEDHYLYKFAKRVRTQVKSQKRRTQKKGKKKIAKLEQVQKKAEQQKEKAKEMAGAKEK